jgi:Zn-dependent protease with chaperone function
LDFGIYGAYFTNLKVLVAVTVSIAGIVLPYLYFKFTRSPNARSWSLGVMLLSSVFLWIFLGISLVLCYASGDAYELQPETAIANVFGYALLFAAGAGLPIAILLRKLSPRILLGKASKLYEPELELKNAFETLRNQLGVKHARLRISTATQPISFALDGSDPVVVVSESLVSLLRKDEFEAVMAHELAHIKNSDTALKAMVTAYRAALPHDPIIRLAEAAFHREREMVADETAAKVTGKPLSLASALLKIYEAFPKNSLRSHRALSILGISLTSRQPPINQRISRLIEIAE